MKRRALLALFVCGLGWSLATATFAQKDAGLPPVSPEASFTVNYDRGFASLNEVARTIRAASRWTIDVPTELDALPVNGKWEGTFVEVIKQIAKDTSVEVTIDTDRRKVVFGLSR